MSWRSRQQKKPHRPRQTGRGLVLSRRPEEQIFCNLPHGGQIVLTAIQCRDGRVRLHLEAPSDVVILRGELVLDKNKKPSTPPPRAAVA